MKTIGLCILFIMLFLSTPLFSQFIAMQDGDKIEVRNISGNYITSGYYSGLKDIAQGDNIIILWYNSDRVEVRSSDLADQLTPVNIAKIILREITLE